MMEERKEGDCNKAELWTAGNRGRGYQPAR